ncbi:MAG TPA: hypothetical protein PKL31_13030 [Fulvivirga sp.]|nr:hypothetical protein [Fulvivirga sp.]
MRSQINSKQAQLIGFIASRIGSYSNFRERISAVKTFLKVCSLYNLEGVNNSTLSSAIPVLNSIYGSQVNADNLMEFDQIGVVNLSKHMVNNMKRSTLANELIGLSFGVIDNKVAYKIIYKVLSVENIPQFIEDYIKDTLRKELLSVDEKFLLATELSYSKEQFERLFIKYGIDFYDEFILKELPKNIVENDKGSKIEEEENLDSNHENITKYIVWVNKVLEYKDSEMLYTTLSPLFEKKNSNLRVHEYIFNLLEKQENKLRLSLLSLYLSFDSYVLDDEVKCLHYLLTINLALDEYTEHPSEIHVIKRNSSQNLMMWIANWINTQLEQPLNYIPEQIDYLLETLKRLVDSQELNEEIKSEIISSCVLMMNIEKGGFKDILNFYKDYFEFLPKSTIESELEDLKALINDELANPVLENDQLLLLNEHALCMINLVTDDLLGIDFVELKDLDIEKLKLASDELFNFWSEFFLQLELKVSKKNKLINLPVYKSFLNPGDARLKKVAIIYLHAFADNNFSIELNDYKSEITEILYSNELDIQRAAAFEVLILQTNISIDDLLIASRYDKSNRLLKKLKYQNSLNIYCKQLYKLLNTRDLEIEIFENALYQLDDIIIVTESHDQLTIDRKALDQFIQSSIEYYFRLDYNYKWVNIARFIDFLYLNLDSPDNLIKSRYKQCFRALNKKYSSLSGNIKNLNRLTKLLPSKSYFTSKEYESTFLSNLRKRRKHHF